MEQVSDAQVMRLIERLGGHYRTNISNRFIRPALLQLSLDKIVWQNIESLTEKSDQFYYQGLHLDEMYRLVASTAKFVAATRREVLPGLRHRLEGGVSGPDKVLRDMVVSTFPANLNIFAGLLCELYNRLKEIDVANAKGRKPLFQQTPEFFGIDDLIMHG